MHSKAKATEGVDVLIDKIKRSVYDNVEPRRTEEED